MVPHFRRAAQYFKASEAEYDFSISASQTIEQRQFV
jgi:hypothetical protein